MFLVRECHFRVRFWPKRPFEVASSQLRELLYRQLEADLKHSRLVINNTDYEADQLIKLGALQQQIEYGDTPGDLSLDLNLAPIELNGRVIDEHRQLRGKSQPDAIDEFLIVATRLQNYGIE